MLQVLNHRYVRIVCLLAMLGGYLVAGLRVDWLVLQGGRWAMAAIESQQAVDLPFPCAGHGCGCQDAQDCQTGCCCYPNGYTQAATTAHDDGQDGHDESIGACLTTPEDSLPPPRIALLDHTLIVPVAKTSTPLASGKWGTRPPRSLSDRYPEPAEPIPRRRYPFAPILSA